VTAGCGEPPVSLCPPAYPDVSVRHSHTGSPNLDESQFEVENNYVGRHVYPTLPTYIPTSLCTSTLPNHLRNFCDTEVPPQLSDCNPYEDRREAVASSQWGSWTTPEEPSPLGSVALFSSFTFTSAVFYISTIFFQRPALDSNISMFPFFRSCMCVVCIVHIDSDLNVGMLSHNAVLTIICIPWVFFFSRSLPFLNPPQSSSEGCHRPGRASARPPPPAREAGRGRPVLQPGRARMEPRSRPGCGGLRSSCVANLPKNPTIRNRITTTAERK